MRERRFHLQQFSLYNHQSAHKVGTDGVLLGCWAGSGMQPQRIVDVGSGTGLIGMMLAQRFPNAHIDLIEKEAAALEECHKSLSEFPWKERVHLIEADVLQWAPPTAYDLVVSNPPYFLQSLPSPTADRTLARHANSNLFQQWVRSMEEWTGTNGRMALILPASLANLPTTVPLSRRCLVQDRPGKSPKRQLLEFSRPTAELIEESLFLKDGDGRWSENYLQWVAPFLRLG